MGRPFLEKFADACLGIGNLEQGAVGLVGNPLINGLGRTPKADDEGVFAEAGQIGWTANETAAGGKNRFGIPVDLIDDLFFVGAKTVFAVNGEDIVDAHLGHAFDHLVGINKLEI